MVALDVERCHLDVEIRPAGSLAILRVKGYVNNLQLVVNAWGRGSSSSRRVLHLCHQHCLAQVKVFESVTHTVCVVVLGRVGASSAAAGPAQPIVPA
jgi:hypothetical protein